MSLIRARRERRELGGAGARKQGPGRLVFLLLLVVALIWWMTTLGG